MTTTDVLDRGRAAFARHAWGDAYAQLSAADGDAALEGADLDLFATAAALTGRDAESIVIWTRAHHEFLNRGAPQQAARCAYHMGMLLMDKGDIAQAGGWFTRARRALDDEGADCVEQGFLLIPIALQTMFGGDPASAHETFLQIAEIAERFADPDLIALGRLGRGAALMMMGRAGEGVALHDDAMVAVMAGEVSPLIAGLIYCAVIESCQRIFDLRRAQEWTTALSRWCESQPDLVPFRGQCLVHRSEILQLHGSWLDAINEAYRAQKWLSEPPTPAVGAAYFQLAEIHRLRGDYEKAEEAYRQASESGRSPQPGLALLRLARGQLDAAAASIRREVDEAQDSMTKSKILPAHVEIMLASDDVAAARASADELDTIAGLLTAPLLRAVAAHANGAVLLSEGDARGALGALRRAWTAWQEIEAPYEAARVRILIGLACRALGDHDGAELEFEAARKAFQQLGAAPALSWLDQLTKPSEPKSAGGLSAREVEVLQLVAAGKTNRAIASELVLSEKTVARHISNIFTKLGVGTRAAATAYAYQHDLA
jgi:DNA-binding CsgD family transcriptional regulator